MTTATTPDPDDDFAARQLRELEGVDVQPRLPLAVEL